MAECVRLTGAVPTTQVAEHFQWAHVFLLPSLCEGSATVTYEALGHGLPVICTLNTGSVVRDEVEGFIVPVRDAAAIAERIERLALDVQLRAQMATNAKARAAEFTGGVWPAVVVGSAFLIHRMSRVAILFDNLGPYHLARLTAAAGECELLAVDVARRSGEYAWDAAPGQLGFQSECLFEGTSSRLDAASIASRLDMVFGRFRPDTVVVPGWASRASLGSVAWCLRRRVPLVVMSESQAKDEPRSRWREAVKRQIVGCFSAALVGGNPHADYIAQLGMPRERVFLGYDAVDNSYFSRNTEILKAEMLKGVSGEQKEESRKLETGVRPPSSVLCLPHGLPERYFLASARFVEKKNLPRLLQAYARRETLNAKAEMPNADGPWVLVLLGDGPLRPDLCRLILTSGWTPASTCPVSNSILICRLSTVA